MCIEIAKHSFSFSELSGQIKITEFTDSKRQQNNRSLGSSQPTRQPIPVFTSKPHATVLQPRSCLQSQPTVGQRGASSHESKDSEANIPRQKERGQIRGDY